MTTNAREQLVQSVADLQEGQRKLASLVAEQNKLLPTAEQAKEVGEFRDRITQKLASLGLIEEIDTVTCRESLDSPGGVETLIDQLLDQAGSQKSAGNPAEGEPVNLMGSATSGPRKAPEPNRGGMVQFDPSGRTYQPLYHH